MPCVFGRFKGSIQSRGRRTKASRIPLPSDLSEKSITSFPLRSLNSGGEAILVEQVDFDIHFEIIKKAGANEERNSGERSDVAE